jgi:hypothetical protein
LVDDVGLGLAVERLLRIGLIERVALPTAAPGDIPDPPGTFW